MKLRYTIKKDKVIVPFSFKTKKVIKNIKNYKWVPSKKRWEINPTEENIKILKDFGFLLRKLIRKSKVKYRPSAINVQGLKHELYPFQQEGVNFIEDKKGRILIGDDMGLGKTIQAVAWMQYHPELNPAIICCPASVKLGWEKEIKEWTGRKDIYILSGKKSKKIGNSKGIFIINYDILGQLFDTESWVYYILRMKPKVLILDECHYIKNHKTNRYKGVKELAHKTPHIIGLSGTPIENRPIELFSALNIIDPDKWPSRWRYAQKYCNLKRGRFGWDYNGASNIKELFLELTDPKEGIMIRRKKKEVLKDLPDKTRSVVPIEIANKREYKKAEADIILWIQETMGRPRAMKAKMAKALVEMENLKQLAVKGKLKNCILWIEDFISTGRKLVVFTTHTNTIDVLQAHFKKKCVVLKGGLSLIKRKEAVDDFKKDSIKLFIGNIKAAGTGIDGLQDSCSDTCFLELGWTPGLHDQAEDRVYRIGQKDHVMAWYLIGVRTIEERLCEMLDKKRKVIERILDGRQVTDESLLTELLNSYNNSK